MRPRAPYGFEYARIAVPELAPAQEFYEYVVGLTPVDVEPGRVTLRADIDHHCIELREDRSLSEMEVLALGFSAESAEHLEDLRSRLTGAGYPVLPIDDAMRPVITDGFATTDPNGIRLEFVHEFQVFAEPPFVEIRPVDIVHPFLGTPEFEKSLAFYTEVLGFLPSDFIAFRSAFLRGEDRYHHSIALRLADKVEVAHICFMMKSFDHVMRGFAKARYKKIPCPSGLVNHSASRSIAFYMEVPRFGPPIELCDGHVVFTPEQHETHVPRRMSADPRNIDVWRAAADDWGLT
ncbi:MAG TPA: VOC family protein [Acidimicrobiales bacterium]|jgi:2,3-dihydroxy-p-cumate/2,3-dihydroxybenzoate 3,4-dioxygenase|nr:VOC family protein [Acidimicrobiales bacterium]